MTKLERDHSLDKGYPISYGYAWAPAAIDDYPMTQLLISKAPESTGVTAKTKTVNNRVFYQKTALGHKLTYNALRGNLTELGVAKDKIKWPGRAVIQHTKFSLYNQIDVGNESLKGKAVRDQVRRDSYVIQDSGGFQLVSGVEDFIDPLTVARKHSLYADSGVSLDLPVSGVNDKAFALVAASMLNANTEVLLQHNDKAAKVMNVCHGATLEIRSAFLAKVTKNPAHSICIAGLRRSATGRDAEFDRSSPTAFTSHILLTLLSTEKLYQHYHVLGAATPWQMALIALIANVHQKIVTSDSASHALSAKSGLLLDYAGEQGYKNSGYNINSYSKTYCSCPMCVQVKHALWYKVGASWMPSIHNIYALLRYADTHDHLAKVLLASKADAAHVSRELLLNSPAIPNSLVTDFQRAIKIILTTKKVDDLKSIPQPSRSTGLFNRTAKSKVPPRFIEIVKAYEAYHKKKWL